MINGHGLTLLLQNNTINCKALYTTGAPPSLATEAVLVKSEAIPEGTPTVRGMSVLFRNLNVALKCYQYQIV